MEKRLNKLPDDDEFIFKRFNHRNEGTGVRVPIEIVN